MPSSPPGTPEAVERPSIIVVTMLVCLPLLVHCGEHGASTSPEAGAIGDDSSLDALDSMSDPESDSTGLDLDSVSDVEVGSADLDMTETEPLEPETTPSECLHDPECSYVFLSAHRGMCKDEPENTLAAYRCCVEAGVPMLEVDTRRTADGATVIMHDGSVTRTTDGEERLGDRTDVDQLTLEEFQQLVIDDPRCAEAPDDNPERCRPPTWADVLELTRPAGTVIFIDLKSSDAADTVREAVDGGDEARIVLFDSNLDKLRAGIAVYPDLVVMPRVGSVAEIETLLASDIDDLDLKWIHGDTSYLAAAEEVLEPHGIRFYMDVFVEVDAFLVAASVMVDPARAQDLRRQAWEAVDRVIAEGADGLGTNLGAELTEYIHPRGFGVP